MTAALASLDPCLAHFPNVRSFSEFHGKGPLVVTFSHWHEMGVPHAAFGRDFLSRHRINTVHIVNAASDWYLGDQRSYETIFDRIRAAPEFRSASAVIGFGSSMGAYAALRFRHKLGLTRVVGFCPQFALDPAKAPFERRWRDEARACNFDADHLAPVSAGEDVTLIYDSTIDHDVKHVELLDRDHHARRYAIPFAGHPPMQFLSDIGLLNDLTLGLLQGEDCRAMLREAYRRRRSSPIFWRRLAERLAVRNRMSLAFAAIDRAIALAPEEPELLKMKTALLSTKESDL